MKRETAAEWFETHMPDVYKRQAQLTAFGKDIGKRLIDLDKPQTWLIEEVRNRTGLYFDDSYMYKIKTGQLSTPKVVQAIREILEIRDCDQDSTGAVQ